MKITANSDKSHNEPYNWIFETEIAHLTFNIMEGEDKFCKGIVFYLDDVKKPAL